MSNALLRRFANSRSPPTSVVLLYIPELKVTFAVALGIKGFTSHALFGLLLLLQRQFKPYIYSLGTGLVSKELALGFKIQSVGKLHKILQSFCNFEIRLESIEIRVKLTIISHGV